MLWIILLLLIIVLINQILIALKLKSRFKDQDRRFEKIETSISNIKKSFNSLKQEIEEKHIETQNSVSLQGLDFSYPVFLGEWSIDSHLAKFLVEYLMTNKPQNILEIGSGSSTVIIGKCIKKIPNYFPNHFTIEHDIHFLNKTKELANLNGITDIHYYHKPLNKIALFSKEYIYYSNLNDIFENRDPELKKPGKLDLVIIDGPPATVGRHARFPALPLLYKYLSDNACLILDDYIREDEKEIVQMWMKDYQDFDLEIIPKGHRCAVLKRQS